MGKMTQKELQDYLKRSQTIILPYGVVEQHGYHLPLDTDIRNACEISRRIARELDCIVAPSVNYCFSGGTLNGTINIKPNTFSNMIGEIIESLATQGFLNIIIIPGHGGTESLLHLQESLRILKWLNPTLKETLIMLSPPWEFSETWMNIISESDFHAGKAETSLIKYWSPEIVKDKITLDEKVIAERLRDNPDSFQKRTFLSKSKYEIPNTEQHHDIKIGVIGYPNEYSIEIGKTITSQILKNLVFAIKNAIAEADKCRCKVS